MTKRYFVWTVGCQMNEADSERIERDLEAQGMSPAETAESADVIVLNTCSVRAAAEERTYGKLGELRDLKRRRPDLIVAVGGCMVGADHSALARRAPHVDLFFRPQQHQPLIDRLSDRPGAVPLRLELAPDLSGTGDGCVDDSIALSGRIGRPARFLNVMSGCNRACTYCIVPLRRGREASRPIADLVEDARRLVAEGAREVTLLGQIVDRYGRDLPDRPDLATLFEALSSVDGLQRIRFLTSHPADMPERVIDAVARLPKVMPHFNIPVQSGDDAMLRRMRRGYTVERYLRLIDTVRSVVPEATIATDVIVGMCGETEAEFGNTLRLIEDVRFDVVHVAMYSPRPETRAADWDDDVPPEVKRARLHAVEEVQERISTEINRGYLGRVESVLVEGTRRGRWEGRTQGNKLVFFDDPRPLVGEIVPVEITRTGAWSLQGEVAHVATPELRRFAIV